jgi:uncharacterized membrane protein
MSASLSPVRLMSPSAMRFGVWRPLLDLIQASHDSHEGTWRAEWLLKRRSLMSVRQLIAVYVGLSVMSLGVAIGFWQQGMPQVLPVATAELAVLALGMLLYVRHTSDRDAIAMKPSLVRVEQHRGGQVRRIDFNPRWVRVEPDLQDGSLVRLSGQGRSVVVGEYVPRDCRPQLAEEFRCALRHLND